MPSSSSSSAQAARQAIADQLREIRERAGLTGRTMAASAGWPPQKISRIEHGARSISAADLIIWCQLCAVPTQRVEELMAQRSAAAGMWTTMQRLHRAGLKQAQESVREMYRTVRHYRCYQSAVVPGLLQTADYTRAGLESVRDLLGITVDDVREAVAERMDRQRILRKPGKRFVFVVEEPVLHHRVCGRDTHLEQLAHLATAMRLPSVSVNIIPLEAERRLRWPCEGFVISEGANEAKVTVEAVSGYLQITNPSEIALYRREFDELLGQAVTGDPARRIIEMVADRL
ncbi:helix-turn-helix domain-containing protein [Kribbella sp. NPDC059898]|uniref:helix-turn-helix domain-containing protein n=1 Tax=Kribbella sp. NPDC059898 TaxID=3346995 RepID=UPI00366A41D1